MGESAIEELPWLRSRRASVEKPRLCGGKRRSYGGDARKRPMEKAVKTRERDRAEAGESERHSSRKVTSAQARTTSCSPLCVLFLSSLVTQYHIQSVIRSTHVHPTRISPTETTQEKKEEKRGFPTDIAPTNRQPVNKQSTRLP